MNEQMTEQTSGEPGSLSAGSAVPNSLNAPSEPVAALAQPSTPETTDVDSLKLAPEQGAAGETPKVDAPKAEAPKAEAPKAEAPKAEASKAEALKTDALKAEASRVDAPRSPEKVMIMSAGDRAGPAPEAEQSYGMFGKRRLAALAAVVALAGALGGAVATAGFGHYLGDGATTAGNSALEATVARIDADIAALKASVEHAAKANTAQFSKTSDRLDKVEKAQAEPAAKLAKLSDAVDKLRVAPVASVAAAAAPAAAKEVTGSTSSPAVATPATAAKPEMARLPTVDGWVLRDVTNGAALIQGRRGMFEVYAGDPIPGLGRVDAIRRQDGRWVVVTGKGLIVAR
ncbi:MAG TPA: hypothetical protein VK620_33010 [Bradyrhizobium sp.]|nr:hypothetical protein [Bradyrhizobium sp.]